MAGNNPTNSRPVRAMQNEIVSTKQQGKYLFTLREQ
jgi:hypothetical protein